MAEVLLDYEGEVPGPDGKTYEARACGGGRDDGMWEGWLEFIPKDGGAPLRTGRETSQPNRQDCVYWATGLTAAYLDGALLRIVKPVPPAKVRTSASRPAYDSPAPDAPGR